MAEATLGTSRLMEALEKLSQWAGGSASGQMPSGTPSPEAVQAFEEALNTPGVEGQQITEGISPHSMAADPIDAVALPGPAEAVPSFMPLEDTDWHVQATKEDVALQSPEVVDAVQPEQKEDELVRELGNLLQHIAQPGAAPPPEALYRAQYLMGILRAQGQAGVNASQQVSQGMENILRQQG